ncbi:hypothetical protein B0T25DRAFT_565537 [Lasiosphaeria hispida]|uniref:Fungal N-terminal domain-containing protein n=1 Tax=Lasiosphaeria hispida TaxID=260671 RepID=A0AAJ0HSJ2_9PEZI|nr:hypothetical protein B0T25DRAFT_565537 [Lasiosphaeria hispida]
MTASITALVTIIAQMAAGIQKLHAFWSSVADAPASLRGLLADIQLVRDLFNGIKSSITYHNASHGIMELMSKLLGRSLLELKSLKNLVKTVLLGGRDNPTKIAWKLIKARLKAEKFKAYRERLELAKLTLVLAHGYASQ